jgi:elongation factor Tu
MSTNSKPSLNIIAIGHIDHGKSTLTAAITTVLSRLGGAKAVRYGEIASNTISVSYETDKRRYSHIDCPQHSDYVEELPMRAAQLDAAVLVVSAPNGPTADAREQISIAQQVGVPYIVVYLNQCDLVDDEDMLLLVEKEILELLTECGYPGDSTVIVRGSALKALNGEDDDAGYGISSIAKLMETLDTTVPDPIR